MLTKAHVKVLNVMEFKKQKVLNVMVILYTTGYECDNWSLNPKPRVWAEVAMFYYALNVSLQSNVYFRLEKEPTLLSLSVKFFGACRYVSLNGFAWLFLIMIPLISPTSTLSLTFIFLHHFDRNSLA